MPKNLTLIKLGGAVITNKEIPESVRQDILDRLVQEITRARKETGKTYIIGNGSGSFAHVPAGRYRTKEGFVLPESRIGMAITQDSAARMNRNVVSSLIKHEIPAVSVCPSGIVLVNGQANNVFTDVLLHYLDHGLVPVVYGDVIADMDKGCTIWSTDKVFSALSQLLIEKDWQVDEIIHVTEAQGVWKNEAKDIYPVIIPEMSPEVEKQMVDVKGFDVTGGMWQKIKEALSLTDSGVKTMIISGLEPDRLYNALIGKRTIGTRIQAKLN